LNRNVLSPLLPPPCAHPLLGASSFSTL
jgi:hypothetical protein